MYNTVTAYSSYIAIVKHQHTYNMHDYTVITTILLVNCLKSAKFHTQLLSWNIQKFELLPCSIFNSSCGCGSKDKPLQYCHSVKHHEIVQSSVDIRFVSCHYHSNEYYYDDNNSYMIKMREQIKTLISE